MKLAMKQLKHIRPNWGVGEKEKSMLDVTAKHKKRSRVTMAIQEKNHGNNVIPVIDFQILGNLTIE